MWSGLECPKVLIVLIYVLISKKDHHVWSVDRAAIAMDNKFSIWLVNCMNDNLSWWITRGGRNIEEWVRKVTNRRWWALNPTKIAKSRSSEKDILKHLASLVFAICCTFINRNTWISSDNIVLHATFVCSKKSCPSGLWSWIWNRISKQNWRGRYCLVVWTHGFENMAIFYRLKCINCESEWSTSFGLAMQCTIPNRKWFLSGLHWSWSICTFCVRTLKFKSSRRVRSSWNSIPNIIVTQNRTSMIAI